MRHAVLALAAALMLAAPAARAGEPGTASGHFISDEVKAPSFAHAVALLLDNAEGQLDHPNELRVLLTEEEAPASALYGLMFPPARAMARAGALHGLLLEFDPADRSSVYVTVLAPPAEPGQSLTTLTLSNSEGVWQRLAVDGGHAEGELKPDDTFDVAARFSTPVSTNPVQQDLKGPAAGQSEPVRVLLARFDAIGRGDMAAAIALSTKAAADQLAAMPAAELKMARAHIPQLTAQLKAAKRVVVRQDTAAVQTADDSWFNLARENGAWKCAD
jgi:hypothetical protein